MKTIAYLAVATLAACTADPSINAGPDGEASLAVALRGYEPSGPPLSCVSSRDLQGNRSVGDGAIIFDSAGSSFYLNRPRSGCPELRSRLALRIRTPSTRFCSGDIVNIFDPASGMEHGSCVLGDFTPYRRVN